MGTPVMPSKDARAALVRGAVRQYLRRLVASGTSAGIAGLLLRLGCHGVRGHPRRDPVGVFLSRQLLPGQEAMPPLYVWGYNVEVALRAGDDDIRGSSVLVRMPDELITFLREFDAGHHPQLDQTGEHNDDGREWQHDDAQEAGAQDAEQPDAGAADA